MTAQQQRFIEEYCKDCNGAAAARRAGYSESTAKEQASRLLREDEVREGIRTRLKEKSLTAEETTKLITDIAKSDLGEFFVVKDKLYTPDVEKPLSVIIHEIEESISFEEEYMSRAQITGKEEVEAHEKSQHRKRLEIIRLQIELERNPLATRWVKGDAYLVKQAELDMVKLVQAKEGNRIKSVKPTEHGLNVEMYAADAALDKLARMHGLFEKDNEQAKPANAVTIFQLPDNGRSSG